MLACLFFLNFPFLYSLHFVALNSCWFRYSLCIQSILENPNQYYIIISLFYQYQDKIPKKLKIGDLEYIFFSADVIGVSEAFVLFSPHNWIYQTTFATFSQGLICSYCKKNIHLPCLHLISLTTPAAIHFIVYELAVILYGTTYPAYCWSIWLGQPIMKKIHLHRCWIWYDRFWNLLGPPFWKYCYRVKLFFGHFSFEKLFSFPQGAQPPTTLESSTKLIRDRSLRIGTQKETPTGGYACAI